MLKQKVLRTTKATLPMAPGRGSWRRGRAAVLRGRSSRSNAPWSPGQPGARAVSLRGPACLWGRACPSCPRSEGRPRPAVTRVQSDTSPRGMRTRANRKNKATGGEIRLSRYLLSTDICYTMCVFLLLYIACAKFSCFPQALVR